MIRNITHENIHSGLSGLRSDEKWTDMLNFRSQNKKTTVIPPKFSLLDCDFRGHTIARGQGEHNYVFGGRHSFGCVIGNELHHYTLWRLSQRYLRTYSSRSEQSQRLNVRGSYTGTTPLKLRLTYVAGRLVADFNVPKPAPTIATPPIDFGCDCACDNEIKITGVVTNSANGLPIAGATLIWSRFGHAQWSLVTNALGQYSFSGLPGTYSVVIAKTGFNSVTISRTLSVTQHFANALLLNLVLPPPILCSSTANSGGSGYQIIAVTLGSSFGTVTLNYEAYSVPDRFVVKYGGVVVIDTGYRGITSYNTDLAALNLPPVTGPGLGTATFVKTSTDPTATVEVYGPLPGTAWNFTLSCPVP